jgi:HPt (histidine-containing phosphotransfer) domain-containing protein
MILKRLAEMMGDKKLANQIIQEFMEDASRQIKVIKDALGNGDATRVHRQAHTLKGVSVNVGAAALQAIAYQIEVAAETGDLVKAGGLVPKVNEQFELLQKTLAQPGI